MSRGRGSAPSADAEPGEQARLDKWLWAARLFKTRALAQAAVDGGKVHYDGQRVKSGHAVRPGARLSVRVGHDERQLIVLALSEQRGPAAAAQALYEETADSIAKRAATAALRQAAALSRPISDGRPNKRQRRQLARLHSEQE